MLVRCPQHGLFWRPARHCPTCGAVVARVPAAHLAAGAAAALLVCGLTVGILGWWARNAATGAAAAARRAEAQQRVKAEQIAAGMPPEWRSVYQALDGIAGCVHRLGALRDFTRDRAPLPALTPEQLDVLMTLFENCERPSDAMTSGAFAVLSPFVAGEG